MHYCQGFNQFGELCLFDGEYNGYCGMHDPNNDFKSRAAWARRYFELETIRAEEYFEKVQQKEREYSGPVDHLYSLRRRYIDGIQELDEELERCKDRLYFLTTIEDEEALTDTFSDLAL
jgi:hypothetical protein